MSTPLSIFDQSSITLPQRSAFEGESLEGDVCIRFLRHLGAVPNSNLSIKVLSAIQFTADMMGYSDAHLTKMLVDHGLRAPRKAFPAAYLDYADQALLRDHWEVGGPNAALDDLAKHWQALGEDIFIAAYRTYDLLDEEAFL